jgi:hypothetical protein
LLSILSRNLILMIRDSLSPARENLALAKGRVDPELSTTPTNCACRLYVRNELYLPFSTGRTPTGNLILLKLPASMPTIRPRAFAGNSRLGLPLASLPSLLVWSVLSRRHQADVSALLTSNSSKLLAALRLLTMLPSYLPSPLIGSN